MAQVPTVAVYGLPVWRVSVEELADLVVEWSAKKESHWIATLNLDYLARVQRDPEFHDLIRQADVFTADGMPVLWACRKQDRRFAGLGRTTGADLTPAILKKANPKDVAIVGGVNPGQAISKLGKNPADYFIFDGKVEIDDAWCSDLAKSIGERSIIFVALGCPKQELMISALRKHLPNAVYIAVGGSFEMMAGIIKRAPGWMQKLGMEWFYRLAREPKRLWRRYLLEYPPGALALYRKVKTTCRQKSSKLPSR
ncbi:MAG: WecB/TagA/CpsF family glycosyltransferase [Fimbriimonadaceae bacterium]|nr:WecB/TagA/CpsF family glycosyltransferase [Fimbriimonadaceae bacterium]